MKSNKMLNYLVNLSFFLYFIVLLIERVISISLSFVNGVNIFSDGFNGYTYTLVFLSIFAWLLYLIIRGRRNIKYLFTPKSDEQVQYKDLCIASGILLLSGMVHTEYTYPVIQFVSYGILIVGILLKVIMLNRDSKDRLGLWLSFIYLVSFSMAIPVMYRTYLRYHIAFHIIEGVGSFMLVGFFTYLLLSIFNSREDLFIPIPLLVMIIMDVPIIALRWKEEINYFVLIFMSLSFVIFLVGFIHFKRKQQKCINE